MGAMADSLAEQEGMALVRSATAAGFPLRLIGSLAVRLRCPLHRDVLDALGRRRARDVDLVGYARDERSIEELFRKRRYTLHPTVKHSREFGILRLIFLHPDEDLKVDVFLDRLIMAHTVDLAGRLELDPTTVPLADLLLSKLQIHEITENDLMDGAALLAEHPLGPEGIDPTRICDVLGGDWGFCHSVLLNLGKLDAALDRWAPLPEGMIDRVRKRITELRDAIESAPKSRRWRLRARIGERVRWYEEVEEVDR
jgi:hypothetical protein